MGENITKGRAFLIVFLIITIPLGVYLLIEGTTGGLFGQDGNSNYNVSIRNVLTNTEIQGATYDIIDFEEEVYLLQNQNQSTIQTPNVSEYLFVNISGYYPSIVVVDNESILETYIIYMYPLPDTSALSLDIIKLNDVFGDFNSTDLSAESGLVNFTLRIQSGDDLIRIGKPTYFPNCTLDNSSYAYVNQTEDISLKYHSLWLGFNVSYDELYDTNANVTIHEFVSLNSTNYNVVNIFSGFGTFTQEIEIVNFNPSVDNVDLIVYYGLIDSPEHLIKL